MRNELKDTTAIADGVVVVPCNVPDDAPPNTNDYWFGLIPETDAAEFLGMTTRWMQAKRQHGGGPIFVRISQRCIRYRRLDLKTYADRQLRLSTSDNGEAVAP